MPGLTHLAHRRRSSAVNSESGGPVGIAVGSPAFHLSVKMLTLSSEGRQSGGFEHSVVVTGDEFGAMQRPRRVLDVEAAEDWPALRRRVPPPGRDPSSLPLLR